MRDIIVSNAKMAAIVSRPFSRTVIRAIRSFQKPSPVTLLTRQKSSSTQPSSVESAKEANWKCRQDLATALRGLHWYGLSEGVCTHLTMMAPALSGDGEVMLMIPHGLHWSQVCNSFYFRSFWTLLLKMLAHTHGHDWTPCIIWPPLGRAKQWRI